MGDNNQFLFNEYGDIQMFQPADLQLNSMVHLMAATLLEYCNTDNMVWKKNQIHNEIETHYESENPDGFDKQLSHYTNWADGCALNNTLYFTAKFLRDLEKAVLKNGKCRAMSLQARECGYVGYAINGNIDKYDIEIIPDALEAYNNYQVEVWKHRNEKMHDTTDWCKYNKEYKEMFGIK